MRARARAAAKDVVPHGRFIYAFCNVRTNQVLYSLSRTLDNSALKQLPDLGANHTPPVLRKDLWRPLYRVELPPTPDGARQGLSALKKLREYRKLHELSWEQTAMMTRNLTDKEIEKEKKKLEDRGGSKKETVYDIIKRQKHKMKVNMVMDQKANSIADLAAVLLEQEHLGVTISEAKQTKLEKWRRRTLEEMERLAQVADTGGIEKITNRIKALRNRLEEMRKDGSDGQRRKLRTKIRDKLRQRQKMLRVAQIAKEAPPDRAKFERLAREAENGMLETISNQIAEAKERLRVATRPERRSALTSSIQRANQRLGDMQVAFNTAKEVKASSAPAGEAVSQEVYAAAYRRGKMLWYAEKFDHEGDPVHLVNRGYAPTYTAEGVTVKWANIMDTEYAGAWPDAVQHERMGYTTRNPPLIDTETIAEYKALQWKGRRENFQLDEGTAEKVERLRAEMGLQPRGNRPWTAEPSDVELAAHVEEEAEAAAEVVEEPVLEDPARKEIPSRVRQNVAQEAAAETVKVPVVEDPARLENLQTEVLSDVEQQPAQEEAAAEIVEEPVVEDPARLEKLQKEILRKVQREVGRRGERYASWQLKNAMNKHRPVPPPPPPPPADGSMDQQPTI